MMLSCRAVDQEGYTQTYVFQVSKLELGLAMLNKLAVSGSQILYACILDNGKRTLLPIEAFDGQSMMAPIQALQEDWQAVLNQPSANPYPATYQPLINVVLQLIDGYEKRIATYREAISQLEQLSNSAQTVVSKPDKTHQLVCRYALMINQYQGYIAKAEAGRKAGLNKLMQLKTYGQR